MKRFNLKVLFYVLIVLNIINLIDVITTHIGMNKGFIEQNNLYAYLFQTIGLTQSMIVRVLSIILFSVIFYKLVEYYCKDSLRRFNESIRIGYIYTIPLIVITINFTLAIINNIKLLGGY